MNELVVPASRVEGTNLICNDSRVEGTNLILGTGADYVLRFRPDVLRNIDTTNAVYETEREEISDAHGALMQAAQSAFLRTMGLRRIKQWEKLLDIQPNPDGGIDNRRDAVMQKMFFRPPYTRLNFGEFLTGLFGDGDYVWSIDYDSYEVIIDVRDDNVAKYLRFKKNVRDVLPANMRLIFSIQYTHLFLEHGNFYGYRHSDLERFTYGELSKYAEWNNM